MLSTSKFFRNPTSAAPSTPTDAQWNYVTALLHGTTEGATTGNIFTDASTNNFTVTPSATPNTIQSAFTPFTVSGSNQSWSVYFPGATGLTDYLSAPANSRYNNLNGVAFSIEFWFYPTGSNINLGTDTIFNSWTSSTGWRIDWDGTNIIFYANTTSRVTAPFASATYLNKWTFVQLISNGTTASWYANGALIGTASQTVGSFTNASTALEIGRLSPYYTVRGYLSNIRISDIARSATVPTAPFASDANTSILLCASSRFADTSSYGVTVTPNGTVKVASTYPFDASASNVTTSAYGSSSTNSATTYYLTAGSNAAYQFGTGDFTVEFWMYCTGFAGSEGRVLQYATDGNWASGAWGVNVTSSTAINWVKSGGSYVSNTYTQNAWNHVAIVRSSSSTKVYVNGVGGTASSDTTDYNYAGTYPLSILAGRAGDGTFTGSRFYGNVSNLRIVKGVAVYTGNFTVPTSPLGATQSSGTNIAAITGTSTSLLTLQNNSAADNLTFLDQSPNYFPVTKNGSPTQGTFSPFAPSNESWSGYFDGTSGQYINTSANAAFNFGTSAFTVEGWVYPTSTTGTRPIIEIRTAAANSTGFSLLSQSGATTLNVYTNGAFVGASTASLTTNAWNHVALTRSSNTWTYWINGQSAGTFTNSSTQSDGATTGPKIGGSTTAGEVWIGYLSNLRIVKGVAVYTGTFTVPTSPLETSQSAGTNIAAVTASQTSLLTLQSNRFVDNSANALTITVNGTPSIQRFQPFLNYQPYSQAAIGGSMYCGSSSDYVNFPDAVWSVGANDFTAEGWVYPLASGTIIFVGGQSDGNTVAGSSWFLASSPSVTSDLYIGGTGYGLTSPNAPLNQWSHLALVRTGGTASTYLNGVRIGTRSDLGTGSVNVGTTTNKNTYGKASGATPAYYANMRVIIGSGPYNANLSTLAVPTGPLSSYPYARTATLCNFSNAGFYDNAMSADWLSYNDAKTKYTNAVGNPFSASGYSMYFDGTGDYLSTISKPDFNLAGGSWTVEAWVYVTVATGGYQTIISKRSGASAEWEIGLNPSRYLYFYTSGTPTADTTAVALNTWTYICAEYDGTNLKFYQNGTLTKTTASVTAAAASTAPVNIATAYVGGGQDFNGYISNVRITKGYNRTITASPTAAFPDIGATAPTTGSAVYRSSGTFTVPAGVSTVNATVVGGGGGGGGTVTSGGGGAGGYLYQTSIAVTAGQTYTVIVGGGGINSSTSQTGNGSNSSALGLVAYGGGASNVYGLATTTVTRNGLNGGSGGGAGEYAGAGTAGSGITGQGNNGGTNSVSNYSGGAGGGGAGAVGGSGSGANAGNGGIGTYNAQTDANLIGQLSGGHYYVAGGGGSGSYSGGGAGGTGGTGGGGTGTTYASATGATAGTANTGGGGGGATNGETFKAGGSGVVIISW